MFLVNKMLARNIFFEINLIFTPFYNYTILKIPADEHIDNKLEQSISERKSRIERYQLGNTDRYVRTFGAERCR